MQMRKKLEEDYTQNTKNHEEEVQLRLKFESKLNNMHSAHRDLESKYKRIMNDLSNANKNAKMLTEKLQQKTDEVTELKTIRAEHETQIAQDKEEIDSLKRELMIKSRKISKDEIDMKRIQDECDMFRYKVQDTQKDNTELKLKIDVLNSTVDGLTSEKKHMTAELKQNKELLNVYETKTKSLMDDLNRTNGELQQNKREMIGFSEVNKEREEKVQQLKVDLNSAKIRIDELELKLGTLQINYDKMEEQLNTTREDHEDVVDKLHKMNKARHDLEIKL